MTPEYTSFYFTNDGFAPIDFMIEVRCFELK